MFVRKLTSGLKLSRSNKVKWFLRARKRGNLKLLRVIDLKYTLNLFLPCIFFGYLKDPFRNSFLAIYIYINGIFTYRIGTEGLLFLDYFRPFYLEKKGQYKKGLPIPLQFLRGGSFIHSLPLFKNSESKLMRSAGLFCQLMRNDLEKRLSYIRIRRGFDIILHFESIVIFGKVCNKMAREFLLGKAGLNHNYGFKPIVRGIAMNPVDHPNGGRTPGGKVYRSYTNRIARSTLKTSTRYKRINKYIII